MSISGKAQDCSPQSRLCQNRLTQNRLSKNSFSQARAWITALACVVVLVGCSTPTRPLHTAEDQAAAEIPGMPGIRAWADSPDVVKLYAHIKSPQPTMLALSGGGPDGAFGAGFLNGWSERGTRPEFTIVTGASAGALIAPFAFLGKDYDSVLENVFTGGEMENFLQFQGLGGFFGPALFSDQPLQRLIARNIDENILAAVAREHQKGRRLFIVTTNLDAQRSTIWDMGAIASSNDPNALKLFRSVMEASASVPGIFSPVLVDVEAYGKRFAEMHVDGGITSNILVVPEAVLIEGTKIFPPNVKPKVYVIVNGRLESDFDVVKPTTIRIAIRSFMTSVHSNTRHTMLASYQFAERRGWNLYLTAIESGFPDGVDDQDTFNMQYMRSLFDYARERARDGNKWLRAPTVPGEATQHIVRRQ